MVAGCAVAAKPLIRRFCFFVGNIVVSADFELPFVSETHCGFAVIIAGVNMLPEQENNIIGMIYEAALAPELWETVLREVVTYTKSNTAIFTAVDQLNPENDFVFAHNIPQEGLQTYQDERIQVIDMKLHSHLWENTGVGGVITTNFSKYSTMYGQDEHVFYEKCLRHTHICYVGTILLDQGKYRWAIFSVHRSPDMIPYTEEELEILKRLGTHIRRALQIHRQIVSSHKGKHDLYAILDYLKSGIILLDHQSSLVYANAKAKEIMEKSSLLWLDTYNRLKTPSLYQAQLNQYILGALLSADVGKTVEVGGVLAIQGEEEQKPFMLSIVPFAYLSARSVPGLSAQKVAIFITSPSDRYQLATDFLKKKYALSRKELQICELFVNGYTVDELREKCGITLSSLRTYFKYILAKTDCSSKVELMHLLMGVTISFEHIQ